MYLISSSSSKARILEGIQVLVVENDRDSGYLYTVLLESRGAKVTTVGSIKDALDLLNWLIPDILICEIRFLGESVYPLIQRVRDLAFISGRTIPILVTSTCCPMSLAEHLTVKVEAYLLKPIDLNSLVGEVRNLVLLSKTTYSLSIQDWISKRTIDKTRQDKTRQDKTRQDKTRQDKTRWLMC